MRKLAYIVIIIEIVAVAYLGLELYQPFDPVEFQATVISSTPLYIHLQLPSESIIYPAPPFQIPEGAVVHMACNRGRWLPVLFDCLNTYAPPPSDTIRGEA